MVTRILFTGGTGKAGRHVLPWLLDRKYQILNFDLQPLSHPAIPTLIGDITDGAQVFNAMTTHFRSAELKAGKAPGPVDAVVHLTDAGRAVAVEILSESILLAVRSTGRSPPASL